MAGETPQPAKRARGSYARLICFRCRERRIKCLLPDDSSIVPSGEPQPPEKACQRCRQQDLDCIVRKTTLGRPNQKRQRSSTPRSSGLDQRESRSPSPHAEDLVLLTLDDDRNEDDKRATPGHEQPSGVQMFGAIIRSFNLTSGLLARDKRFGSSIAGLQDLAPRPIEQIISLEVAELLDHHLIWHKLYMPWLPSLPTLLKGIRDAKSDPGRNQSTDLVLALLSSIALDIPSDRLTAHRYLQQDLRCITYHIGQKILFTLPRHDHTLLALELVHGHRPLAFIHSQQAVAHTLSGTLYGTLINALQRRLGLDAAPSRLREILHTPQDRNVVLELAVASLRWCASLMFCISLDLEEVETNRLEVYEPEITLNEAFQTVAIAIEQYELSEVFFLFHVLRYHADDWAAMRETTADWQSIPKLAEHIAAQMKLRNQRKKDFDEGLHQFFLGKGRFEEALAYSQLASMERSEGHSNVVGISMFYAIMSGTRTPEQPDSGENAISKLRKYYTDRVLDEASNALGPVKSEIYEFLDKYGDMHMDALEKRLTDFINATTEVKLQGVPFVGPSRHTSANVLMACKEIVENNAVRIKIDGGLHERFDLQLILFQEAARRLEAMEADGGTPNAVERGSVLAASAKVVRNLHRIMLQWKRNYAIVETHSQQQPQDQNQNISPTDGLTRSAHLEHAPPPSFHADVGFTADILTEWDSWPQFGPNELSGLFTYDFDSVNMI